MKARFLEDVEINDKKHGYKMVINKDDVLEVTEHENHYELLENQKSIKRG